MRISDWSSDVCSSDLVREVGGVVGEIGVHLEDVVVFPLDGPAEPREIRGTQDELLRAVEDVHAWVVRGHVVGELDRKSVVEGKRVSGSVDVGGSRVITKEIKRIIEQTNQAV